MLPARTVPLLLAHPLLSGGRPQQHKLRNTYYDTPNLALYRARIALRIRQIDATKLQTVKSAGTVSGGLAHRNEWERPHVGSHFDFSEVDQPDIRKILDRHQSQLKTIFTTHFCRTSWLLTLESGARIEIALDRGHIESSGRHRLIRELELELKAGEPAALFDLARELQQTLPLHPVVISKAEQGYALMRNKTSPAVRAKASRLSPAMSPTDAYRHIASNCLEQLQRNETGLITGADDPEYLHQTRIALRRLQSVLHLFDTALPAGYAEHWELAWRDLAHQTGNARNQDVLTLQTLPRIAADLQHDDELSSIIRISERARATLHQQIRRTLRSPEYSRLLIDFSRSLHTLPDLVTAGRRTADKHNDELDRLMRHQLSRLAHRANDQASQFHQLDTKGHHRMRIACKALRYALESFAPLLPEKKTTRYLKQLDALQDVLGQLNDLAVARTIISGLRGVRPNGSIMAWLDRQVDTTKQGLIHQLRRFDGLDPPWK